MQWDGVLDWDALDVRWEVERWGEGIWLYMQLGVSN